MSKQYDPETKKVYALFERGSELEMTLGQALYGSASGDASGHVRELSRCPEIAIQLDKLGADQIRAELSYLGWEDEKLTDERIMRDIFIWEAACQIREERR